jgi:hypothetical protein
MGRGAEAETRAAADAERARQDAMNQQIYAQNQALRDIVAPQYQAILAAPGYTDAEKAAITGQSLGALGSAFDALQQRASNRLARTQNAAGFGELEDELARERGRQSAGLARQNEIDFADTAYQRQLDALRGLSSLYGVDTGLLARSLGLPADYLNVRQQASRSSGGFRFGLGPIGFSFGG